MKPWNWDCTECGTLEGHSRVGGLCGECYAKTQDTAYTCKSCGKLCCTDSYSNGPELKEAGLCSNCGFWMDVIEGAKTEPEVSVRVGGGHWVIGDENQGGGFRGYGGRKFKIRFKDGREVETTNLWHNGTIPEHLRNRLPDNAEFLAT